MIEEDVEGKRMGGSSASFDAESMIMNKVKSERI